MSQARQDADLIARAIDSMRQGCGCARDGLPQCQDKRCPNSPAWGGLIQFGVPDDQGNWRDPREADEPET